jgi:putative transposase
MRKSRFTEEQIITLLKDHAAGTPAKELCRRLGVGVETLYRWKHKYGGMEVSEARRLRALENENRRLKKLVADLAPDNAALKDVLSKRTCSQKTGEARGAAPGGSLPQGRVVLGRASHLRAGIPLAARRPGKSCRRQQRSHGTRLASRSCARVRQCFGHQSASTINPFVLRVAFAQELT